MTTLPLADNQMTLSRYRFLKRGLDIAAGLFGCFCLLLLMPFLWLGNFFWNRGPLFYRQERVGQLGRSFQMLKLRSMGADAEQNGTIQWARQNDPRATTFGRLLRRTHLDELPQFWHILIGEMSLIGPRPERPYFVHQLIALQPKYALRHTVKPGLTGYAQVTQGYVDSVEGSLEKLTLDLFYIQNQSLRLDLKIIFQTLPAVWRLTGW